MDGIKHLPICDHQFNGGKICSGCIIEEMNIQSKIIKGRLRNHNIAMDEYASIHYWLRKNYGKATLCENKECSEISKKYHWALVKGRKYCRRRNNFIQLCCSCHSIQDLTVEGRQRMSELKKGKPASPLAYLRMKATNTGRKYTKEHREAMSKGRKIYERPCSDCKAPTQGSSGYCKQCYQRNYGIKRQQKKYAKQ